VCVYVYINKTNLYISVFILLKYTLRVESLALSSLCMHASVCASVTLCSSVQKQAINKFNTNLELGRIGYEYPAIQNPTFFITGVRNITYASKRGHFDDQLYLCQFVSYKKTHWLGQKQLWMVFLMRILFPGSRRFMIYYDFYMQERSFCQRFRRG